MAITLLAISGSLRAKSTNTRLLQEIGPLIGSEVSFSLYDGIEKLPAFNPDKESTLDSHTQEWIVKVRLADAIIVASPEYAHGIPGSLKNALDWLVGSDAFVAKPFCQYRACPRSTFAPAALLEVLRTMSGIHVEQSDLMIDLKRQYEGADDILSDESNKLKIQSSISHLCGFSKALKV